MWTYNDILKEMSRIASDPNVPCIQCGRCCTECPCGLSKLGNDGKCIFLLDIDGKHPCRLAAIPEYSDMLGIGLGCLGGRSAI